MNCNKCGTPIVDGHNFCTRCGAPAPKEKRCPNCQELLREEDIFCGKCGTRYGADAQNVSPQLKISPIAQEAAAPQVVFAAAPQQEAAPQQFTPQQNCQPMQHDDFQFAQKSNYTPNYASNHAPNFASGYNNPIPRKFHMMSMYTGEPTVGIAKATGTLTVYNDRLEYTKVMGNALGGAFGLAGMAIAAKQAVKGNGKVDMFYFRDIRSAHVGKYSGMMPTLVITLQDGSVFSYAGTLTNQTATEIVNTILAGK